MKNTLFLLFATFCLTGQALFAQDAPEPWASSGVTSDQNALVAAVSILGFQAPESGTTDWIGVVDADDANVLLAFARADVNSLGDFVSAPVVNQPTGASNSFHFILYDVSTQMFHVLNDDQGEPLEIEWAPDNNGGVFVAGFEIGPTGAFPGEGSPLVPGEGTFDDVASLLPVELTFFAGTPLGKSVNLRWSTASEDGNEGFNVERSTDGQNFSSIGTVRGAGTSVLEINYNFTDESPATGVNFYRLRQNDFNGRFDYSEVIQVNVSRDDATFRVFPNPARSSFNLRLSGEWNESMQVALLDQAGKVVRTWSMNSNALTEMLLPDVVPGIYQIRTTDSERTVTTRLVIN